MLRALCSFETLQAPLDVREAFLKPPEKVMELVLVAALVVSLVAALVVSLVVALAVVLVMALAVVLVMALAVVLVMALAVVLVMALAVSLVVALGHFGFHVAKQFFGLFVFALFAQFIDFAFGLLDEITGFPVLFTFVAFALAIAFAVVGAVTLTAVTLSGRFAGASSCRSSGVFPGSFSGVSPGPLARTFTGPLARALPGLLAFFFTILLLSQGGQDEQADQGKN